LLKAETVSTNETSPRSYAPMLKSLKYSTWFDTVIGAARSAPLVML